VNTRTPATDRRFIAYPVSSCSRPRRESSDAIRIVKAAGFNAFNNRTNPGRFSNSAPLMPSSTKTNASSMVQRFAIVYCRACSICLATDFCSSATPD